MGKRGLRQFTVPKVPTEFSSGIGTVITKKYQPNTDQKYQIGIQL
jgi:hypothetical protein